MSTAIRATKLYLPRQRSTSVPRPRLTKLLDEGRVGRLTLVSAPAGFGKTTAVAEWVSHLSASSGPAVAWLSLDEADSEPARFLAYLIAALRTAVPHVGVEALALLESTPTPSVEPVLTSLLNELAGGPTELVLMLDDYHVIDSDPVDDILTFVLDQLPPQVHVVLTTREDPRLPLPRLRARGQLTELRAGDLRFTAQEAAEFLATMGLSLSAHDAARLENRTEGWIAGLQLAALSLRGRQDVSAFIDSFAGSHRFVLDYLFEEVLQRQGEEVRDFLLRTSILERLTGSLCDAVTGGANAQETLTALERANLFVVPLDDQRRWYRYHHLFADVLRAYAETELRGQLPELEGRASAWHEQHGSVTDAIRHALAVPDTERAANLIEATSFEMRRTRQGATLLRWIESLPPDVVRSRPLLRVALAATMLDSGRLEAVEEHLLAAERWLESAGGDPMADQLPGLIAMHRAGLAMVSGDAAGAAHHAWQALAVAPEEDLAARGGALGLVGLAHWSGGELEEAHHTFAEGMALLRAGGFVADSIGGVASLADIRAAQGRLNEAIDELNAALVRSAELAGADPRGALGLHVSLSELLRERNDLTGAERHLHTAKELGDSAGWAQSRPRWCVALALVKAARGELDEAADLVDQAGHLYTHDFFPNVRPTPAVKARIDLARGRFGAAEAWVDSLAIFGGEGPDPAQLTYLREYEHLTAARVVLASSRQRGEATPPAAGELLDLLAGAAEAGGRKRSLIEILVLRAVTETAGGDVTAAATILERALLLAESQGYLSVFLDDGAGIDAPLRQVEGHAGSRHVKRFAQELLEAHAAKAAQPAPAVRPRPGQEPGSVPWLEPLTERELEVLVLIAEGLSNDAIARRLHRAESTIKGVNRIMFDKLQATSRTEAVARAREFGLL